MHLGEALPRFYSEAIAAIAAKRPDELPRTDRAALLDQFERLVLVRPANLSSGSFRVIADGRSINRGYLCSIDFDIPSGIVIADLDLDREIIGFEPISLAAIDDIRAQLEALGSS